MEQRLFQGLEEGAWKFTGRTEEREAVLGFVKAKYLRQSFGIAELSRILQCSRTPTLAKVQNTNVQGHIPSPARLSSPLSFNPPQSGYSIFSLLQNFSFPTNLINVNIPQKSILFSVNILVSEHTYPPHDLISHPSTVILKSTFPA